MRVRLRSSRRDSPRGARPLIIAARTTAVLRVRPRSRRAGPRWPDAHACTIDTIDNVKVKHCQGLSDHHRHVWLLRDAHVYNGYAWRHPD